MVSVLVTGFGPFPGTQDNASARYSCSLARLLRRAETDACVVHCVLPTEWAGGPITLLGLRLEHAPCVILHFGVSRFARGLQLETVARNICGPQQDACGAVPGQANVVAAAPMMLRATYPTDLISTALTDEGIDHSVSDDAGTYLCNTVLYRSLLAGALEDEGGAQAERQRPLVGFIHLPENLGDGACALSWRASLRGGMIAARTCLAQVRQQG